MKRRTLLLGVAAASTGITGTGAFSAARAEREANISVTNDADSWIGLVPNDRVAGVKEVDGEFAIALSETGINVNSAYQFGAFVDDDEVDWEYVVGELFDPILYEDGSGFDYEDNFESAFAVVNRTQESKHLEMTLDLSSDDGTTGSDARPEVYFQIHSGSTILDTMNGPGTLSTDKILLDTGTAVGVSFAIDATDSHVGDSLSGTLSVRSEAAGE